MKKGDFIVLDLETTGLSKDYHKITEICAFKLKDGDVIDIFHTLVNPKVKIPSFIRRLTGIDDEMVKDAPLINEVLPDFLNFIEDIPLVAHNATFDYNFLNHNCIKHLKGELSNEKVCTRKLAHRLLPKGSTRLSYLCEVMDVELNNAHRAKADAMATVQIFNKFIDMAEARGIKDIIAFQR